MIEKLLAAFAEGADDSGLRPGIGAQELADILWLAARVDPAARPPRADPAPGPPAEPPTGPAEPPRPEDSLPRRPAAAGEPPVQLFPASVRDRAGKDTDPAGGRRGVPLRLPRAASLDDPLALMRSLRPVGRRSIGGPGEELDEQLTVERSIERMVPTPVLRPAESRWLDLALVVDTHHSMLLWSDLVEELRGVLTRSGVFRDVRTWQLTGTGSGATPMVTRGRGGPPRNPLELADPAGRRLILVVSDTVAGGWREAPLQGVLRHWCAHNSVAVLNVLPERLWTRGAVRPVPFAVRADRPATATRSWQQVPAARRARGGGSVVPVVGIASGSLARLVRVVSGDGRWRRLACLRLDAEAAHGGGPPRHPVRGPLRDALRDPVPAGGTALEVVERFRAGASPTAQQLAAHLAAVPLTLPVMTLVRRSLLRDSEHGHLAEVALGGLFAPWGAEQAADEAEFEFLPGVREALLGSQLRGDVAAVRELVRRKVWEFMSRHRGTGPDFSVIRFTTGQEGRRKVPEQAMPFATQPVADPGLRERLVRVRFEPMAEPQEVGTLLTPRLVLTVGDVQQAHTAVAWVRAGEHEVRCRPVWWDDATPRVFVLLAGEDLVDPRTLPELTWAAEPDGPGRAHVDGFTDQGEPIALTGEVIPYAGARNGELVGLSSVPEGWTHYGGAPVSRDGELVGVVHSVWPDRMVFLSGHALVEQSSFRGVLAAQRGERQPSGATRPVVDPGASVCLALHAEFGPMTTGSPPSERLISLVTRLLGETAVTGPASVKEDGKRALVVVQAPGALGKAGRLLAELPRAMESEARGGSHTTLAVAVGAGEIAVVDAQDAFTVPAVDDAFQLAGRIQDAQWPQWPVAGGSLVLAVSDALYGALGDLLGPTVLRTLEPVREGGDGSVASGSLAGWVCTGDPGELGQAVTEAEGLRYGEVDWPCCAFGVPANGMPACIGVQLPGSAYCLAHQTPAGEEAYLGTLGPGASVDLRGTTFADGLLTRLLDAVRDPVSGRVTLGSGFFDRAQFKDDWSTEDAEFSGDVSFQRAVFGGRALFGNTDFTGLTSFHGAVFRNGGVFDRSRFHRPAAFRRALFVGPAGFTGAEFREDVSFRLALLESSADLNRVRAEGGADFTHATFGGLTGLTEAVFLGRADFTASTWERDLVSTGARFEDQADFGHATFCGKMVMENAVFEGSANFPSASFQSRVSFGATRFKYPVDFNHARFDGPAAFEGTHCGESARFAYAAFSDRLLWRDARFVGLAAFRHSAFHGQVRFEGVQFGSGIDFDHCAFHGPVEFLNPQFQAAATFRNAAFSGPAEFARATVASGVDLPNVGAPGRWHVDERPAGFWHIRLFDPEDSATG
ncbi:pentapeptide repeat-containing protein [Streptomyces sp. ISL-86]|uniref:pentapeptide repeat-containing protein n=1 Tax=Streptomyces sp. ISL-86 TaxID=2819187 RepID=UPI001BE87745|nr:pentapeptide repeat-containing protein [Streptomyces sp. ISL-86]MBT2454735.1 pentapeptide repeat-containing protein [Streptomyces sp. ISL-86]